jgi:DNA polymerase-3 subunit delta'
LIERDGIAPGMADYAARVSQGHIGRARHLASDEAIRSRRNTILNLPFTINSLASAFAAAATLVAMATEEAGAASSERDEKESQALGLAWGQGATGRSIATGGAKALKELEKEQKSRATRMVRDSLDGALLDLATLYRDVLMAQSKITDSFINRELSESILAMAENVKPQKILQNINEIMKARTNLSFNAAPLLTIEALMCTLSQ